MVAKKRDEPWFWVGYRLGLAPIHWKGIALILSIVGANLAVAQGVKWLKTTGRGDFSGIAAAVLIASFVIFFIVWASKTDWKTKSKY